MSSFVQIATHSYDQAVSKSQEFLGSALDRIKFAFANAFASWSTEQKIVLMVALVGMILLIIAHPPRNKTKYGESKPDFLLVAGGLLLVGGYTLGVAYTTLTPGA